MPRGMVGTVASQSSFRSFLNIQSEPWLIPLTGSSRPSLHLSTHLSLHNKPRSPLSPASLLSLVTFTQVCDLITLPWGRSPLVSLWRLETPSFPAPLSLWRLPLPANLLPCTFQATSLLNARTGFFGCLLAHSVSPELESHRWLLPRLRRPLQKLPMLAPDHMPQRTSHWTLMCSVGSSNSGHSLVHPTEECRKST